MPNVLLITVDDMNYNSLGFAGCTVPDISPNLDQLASQSVYFENAHVTISVCQPSRSTLLTGLYPHHNGAAGFNPIDTNVRTLTEYTREAGYFNGIIGKVNHLEPEEKFCWDYSKAMYNDKEKPSREFYEKLHGLDHNMGRNPAVYYRYVKEFLSKAAESAKPFFLMVNSHDPHRPFAGSESERKMFGYNTKVSRQYRPEEVTVPGFLPDIPKVRQEVSEYYSSVHRADETVGEILRALGEHRLEDDTVIFFLSDNGMSFPYAKTNCYLNSTRTPLLVCWKDHFTPRKDSEHFVSGIDFMPTVLELLNIPCKETDGRSYLPALTGEGNPSFPEVFTSFHITSACKRFPMRCVLNQDYCYIYNFWSDGKTVFENEGKSGRTFSAMREAGEWDEAIKARADFYEFRCREELYHLAKDPDALCNLANEPEYAEICRQMRKRMKGCLKETADEYYADFCTVFPDL